MNDKEKNIKNAVLEEIKSGKINMKPRLYFVLSVASLIVVSLLTLLVSSLLASFIIFSLAGSGKFLLFGFGLDGLLAFITLFPWALLVIEIILVALLELIIKKFKFGYRLPLSRLILFIVLISLFVSLLINVTPLHAYLQQKAEQRKLPLFGNYYREINRPPKGREIFRGVVSEVGTSSFVLAQEIVADDGSTSSEKVVVKLPPKFKKIPKKGDSLFVAGHEDKDKSVRAYGFEKFNKKKR